MSGKRDVLVLLGDPRLPDPVKRNGRFNPEDEEAVAILKEALGKLTGWNFSYADDHESLIEVLLFRKKDLVFNLCDEGFRNDPDKELHVPALLELLDLPYTGSGPACLGLCRDKFHVNAIASSLGIPVPRSRRLDLAGERDIAEAAEEVGYPVILKPERGDGSIGIGRESVVASPEGIASALDLLREQTPETGVLVEEFLAGAEYIAGLVGNLRSGLEALPVLEVDFSLLPSGAPCLLCYESKWHPESDYWNKLRFVPAALAPEERAKMLSWCELLFERLGCRDYARMDFRADAEGRIKLLEVNPNPGWCWDGKLALMAEEAGWRYGTFLERILDAATARAEKTALGLPSSPSLSASGNRRHGSR